MRKCNCGNDVARNARFCPKCGHRFTSAPVKVLAWFFGIVFVLMLIGALGSQFSEDNSPTTPSQPQTPAQVAAQKKRDTQFAVAVLGAKTLRKAMRNPDSFKLSQVLIMADGSVCYEYRAQNGFGGMNIGHAVLDSSGKFRTDEMSAFTATWNKKCANKTGEDKTRDVGYAAGLHGILDSQ